MENLIKIRIPPAIEPKTTHFATGHAKIEPSRLIKTRCREDRYRKLLVTIYNNASATSQNKVEICIKRWQAEGMSELVESGGKKLEIAKFLRLMS